VNPEPINLGINMIRVYSCSSAVSVIFFSLSYICHQVEIFEKSANKPNNSEIIQSKVSLLLRIFFSLLMTMTLSKKVSTGSRNSDVPAASAILDRFLHHAQTIAITGRSYRLKDKAAKETNQPKESKKDDPAPEAKS